MFKNYRWLPAVLLAVGVSVATPACVASIHSARIDYRQGVQQRAYEQGHRKGFDRGRDDVSHGRPQQYERYRSTGTRMTAIAVMTASATSIAVYFGKDFVTAIRRRSMSDAKGTAGTGGASGAVTPQATRPLSIRPSHKERRIDVREGRCPVKLMMATTVATTLALTPLLAADNEPAKRLDEAAAGTRRSHGDAGQEHSAGTPRECPLHRDCPGPQDRSVRRRREIRKRIPLLSKQERSGLVAPNPADRPFRAGA